MSAGKDEVVSALGLEGGARRGKRRWIWVAIAVLVVAAAIGVQHSRRADAPSYVTESAREGPLRVIVTATGTLQPTNQVDVGSEVSGIIDKVLVDFNDTVKQGQVIAQLDT